MPKMRKSRTIDGCRNETLDRDLAHRMVSEGNPDPSQFLPELSTATDPPEEAGRGSPPGERQPRDGGRRAP
jgi:hypothetical protein